ncbi:MAG: HAD family hydrolase [Spirochaetes bacterium]|nr:HAD family hydrolase [Spirochaetota bacterium]
MKTFAVSSEKTVVFFDMDCTLYTHDEYAQSQIDLPVMRLAQIQGKSFERMKSEVAEYRKTWADNHNGKAVSLGNIFLSFGIPIKDMVSMREELYRPEDYLAEDKRLRYALTRLASRYKLAVVTNNPVSVAVRTLSILGIHDILGIIVGLDTCYLSKPDKEIFLKAAQLCGVSPQQCISVGDRYDIDLAVPIELGMGGVLVDGVEDVYSLPDILL